ALRRAAGAHLLVAKGDRSGREAHRGRGRRRGEVCDRKSVGWGVGDRYGAAASPARGRRKRHTDRASSAGGESRRAERTGVGLGEVAAVRAGDGDAGDGEWDTAGVVRVTPCAALPVTTCWLPKETEVGERPTVGAVADVKNS